MKNLAPRLGAVRFLSATLLLTSLGSSGVAIASEELPTEFLEVTDRFECLPACSNCHTSDPGQSGTASKRLAQLLQGNEVLTGGNGMPLQPMETPLNPAQPETLHLAYDYLDLAGQAPNTEPDGIITDPQTGDVIFDPAAAACQAEVDYGCSVDASHPAGGSSFAWWAPLVLSALGFGVFARRRRTAR